MKELIQGAYDLHVHSAPDVLPRKLDDLEMGRRIAAAGMGGYCIKSHYFCTGERAELLRAVQPDCDFLGSLVLNSTVGGLNPAAVELAARSGAKLIWMPTCDSAYEREHIFGDSRPEKLPFWANIILELKQNQIQNPTIRLLEEGAPRQEVLEILAIARSHDMAVATGHISHQETFALARAAKEMGLRKLIITHVNFPSTFYTLEEQQELLACGAFLEHCYTTYATGKVDFAVMLEQIRRADPERVFISSDLGQKKNVYPDEGILDFSKRLVENGFTPEAVHRMNREIPKYLAGR